MKINHILLLLLIIIPHCIFSEEIPIKITATKQYETDKDIIIFEGYVLLEFKDINLQADKVTFDRNNRQLIAEKNVLLTYENSHISAEKLILDLRTEKAILTNIYAYEDPLLTIMGVELTKDSESDYKGKKITVHECKQRIPHWSVSAKKAHLKVDKWIRMSHFTFKIKNIPVFYFPFFHFPLNKERSTGFLFPRIGPNDRKGFYIGNGFFWAINRSNDLTFYVDRWWDRGWGEGTEYQYALEKGSGRISAFFVKDTLIGNQWSINGNINQTLPKNFQLAGQWDWFSSLEYIQEYENSFSKISRRYKLFRTYLTKNWSYYSLNAIFENQDTLFSINRSISTRKIPKISFQRYSQKLFNTPLFLSYNSSISYFGKTIIDDTKYFGRINFYPELSLPLTGLRWLTFTPTIGFQTTYYTKTLDQQNQLIDDALLKKYVDINLDLRGPNLSRIYELPENSFTPKIKHTIEPRITYQYATTSKSENNIISMDEVDSTFENNMLSYGITNRIFIKKKIGTTETPWELLSWDISQSYYINIDSTNNNESKNILGPISSYVRFNPSNNFQTEYRLQYSWDLKKITSMNLSNSIRYSVFSLNLAWNYYNYGSSSSSANNQLRTNLQFSILNNKFNISNAFDFNITKKELMSFSLGIIFNDDCYSIGVEYKKFNIQIRQESQINFFLSFPRIGKVLDYHAGIFNELY